jgi:hypothetical protein
LTKATFINRGIIHSSMAPSSFGEAKAQALDIAKQRTELEMKRRFLEQNKDETGYPAWKQENAKLQSDLEKAYFQQAWNEIYQKMLASQVSY